MSYMIIHVMQANESLRQRITACAAQEGGTWQVVSAPLFFYRVAGAPGWDTAWESALVSHPEADYDPGSDDAVITDGMILSQVQEVLA